GEDIARRRPVDLRAHPLGEDQIVVCDADPLDDPLVLGVVDELARLAYCAGEQRTEPGRVDRTRDPDARLRAGAALELERDEQLGLADHALAREHHPRPADHERTGRPWSPAP